MIPEDFSHIPTQNSVNLIPEEAYKMSEDPELLIKFVEEEELPPETRISATPIGSGFVNIINLDEPVRERIRRSLSPPLQEPRHHDSSDSDSDFDVEFIMKRPPRPPSRRQYIIERSKSPIDIAPVVNRIDDQMVIENQALKRRIFQLQTDNMNGQKQIQQLQNEDQKNKRYIKNLSDYTEDLCTQISNLQSENSIYKKHITEQINKQNKN